MILTVGETKLIALYWLNVKTSLWLIMKLQYMYSLIYF